MRSPRDAEARGDHPEDNGDSQVDKFFDFTGKVVLVTGGSRGLGRAMTLAFAERGADVVIASRSLDACEALAGEVRGMGRRARRRLPCWQVE